MNRLEQIIGFIDTDIATGLTFRTNEKGLAYRVEKEGREFPARYVGSGDWELIELDDSFPFMSYHRLIGESESSDYGQGFGSNILVTQAYSLRYVAFGVMKLIKTDGVDISHSVKDDITRLFPRTLSQARLTTIEARTATITPGSKQTNQRTVFAEEYPELEFKVSPDNVLLFIDYELSIMYYENCRTENLCP